MWLLIPQQFCPLLNGCCHIYPPLLIFRTFVHGCRNLLRTCSNSHRGIPLRKQIPFLPNGDLWLVYWRTLVARGTQGVQLKKTKGHALKARNKDYPLKHPELRNEARLNNRADEIAEQARLHFSILT